MTEVPMPPMGGEPGMQKPSAGRGFSKIVIVIAVIAILFVAGLSLGFFSNISPTTTTTTTTSTTTTSTIPPSHSTRQIVQYLSTDVNLYPSFYSGEFAVYSSETQTSVAPDFLFDITISDTGSDLVYPSVHYAVYNIDMTTFNSLSWAALDSYLVEAGDDPNPAWDYIDLHNYADTYVWVFWFEASSKTTTWVTDITLTLRYNWNL
ncbi:MAG: hypothetical protein RTU30_06210 [Candidatus Thorarchaeota archaeon]